MILKKNDMVIGIQSSPLYHKNNIFHNPYTHILFYTSF